MIANNSVRSAISVIHLAIALFCVGFFSIIVSDKTFNLISIYRSRDFFSLLSLGFISMSSFIGFLSWQTAYLQTSKRISYFLVVCFLMSYITFFNNFNHSDLIGALVVIFTPAIFLFLLAFSKIGQIQIDSLENKNNALDSDFLISPTEESNSLSVFWKPNRIVSVSSCVFAILLFIFLLDAGTPIWVGIIPCIFLIASFILWHFSKTGSWIFAIVSSLAGIGIVVFFIVAMITKPLDLTSNKEIKLVLLGSIIICSLFLLCIGIAMLLLSKEAKEEWKSNKSTISQN